MVGPPRVRVPDVGGEELEEAVSGLLAGVGDGGRNHDLVSGAAGVMGSCLTSSRLASMTPANVPPPLCRAVLAQGFAPRSVSIVASQAGAVLSLRGFGDVEPDSWPEVSCSQL